MKINTLVVDDDANWRFTISKFVGLHPALNLIGTCASAIDAFGQLSQHQIDLIICDVEMPELSGIGLARTLKNGPLIIFVTAHAGYAVEGYEVSPIDFLLKPLNYERFLLSIEKVKQRLANNPESSLMEPYFLVQEVNEYWQIAYRDVLYMKASDHFLQIVTPSRVYTPLLSISKIEEKLKGDVFLRIHRSYLVNRSAILSITKNEVVLINGERIPIGDQYRAQFKRQHIGLRLVK